MSGRPKTSARRPASAVSALADVHERFLAAPDEPLPSMVRQMVADSWRRSLALGVDATTRQAPLEIDEQTLAAYRDQHPISAMMPMIRSLLTEDAEEAGHIVAVADARGRLLWVEGQRGLRRRAEGMHFVEGALWSESGAGTNAPGTALALDVPVQIRAAEHFGVGVQAWSCVAAPVHDPLTGELLGVIDLTGGPDVAGPRTLALVRACAAAVESGLALRVRGAARAVGASVRVRTFDTGQASLRVMGADEGVLDVEGRVVRLSRRHTELVWLLAGRPHGASAQELDVALHQDGEHLVTIRAEINRLRHVLGDGVLASRPYRLTSPVRTDVDEVRAAVSRGDLATALDCFTGAPMPGSDAPAVVELRDEFVAELRQAVLDSADAPTLQRWTACRAGHDDLEAWTALALALAPGAPDRAIARAHVTRLERQNAF